MNGTVKLKFGLERTENIVRKGENAGSQHFLLFPKCLKKPSSLKFSPSPQQRNK